MNQMKYYVDAEGNYLGGWDANPPDGAIEAPFPPEDARQKWNGFSFSNPQATIADQITSAPDDLFGGPTLKEIFDGN